MTKLPSDVLCDTKRTGRFNHRAFYKAIEAYAALGAEGMKAELEAARAAGRFDPRYTADFWRYTSGILGVMAALSMMRAELRAAIVGMGVFRQ